MKEIIFASCGSPREYAGFDRPDHPPTLAVEFRRYQLNAMKHDSDRGDLRLGQGPHMF
jgi:hypothetical protein